MSWPSGLLSVHWLSVCWANGKREGQEKKKEKWGEERKQDGKEKRGEALFILVRLSLYWVERWVCFQQYAIDSKLSSNMRCWGVERLHRGIWDSHISKHCSSHSLAIFTIWIIHWLQCEIDASVLTDTVCLKGTKGCPAGQISLTCYTF